MEFCKIDLGAWPRKETFDHYVSEVPCTYSMTVKLDITVLRRLGVRLYPAMLYALTTIVNRHPEFRTALDEHGQVGVFSQMLPCYTVFHRESETFSNLWTEYHPDFARFLEAYQQDLTRYGHLIGMAPSPIHRPTPSRYPWCPGPLLRGSTSTCKRGTTICCPWPSRYTTASVTVSISAAL